MEAPAYQAQAGGDPREAAPSDGDEPDWRGLLEMSEVELDDSRTSLN